MIIEINTTLINSIADGVKSVREDDIEGVLNLKDDRFILMSQGGENVSMFASRVPAKSMKQYDRRGIESIGIDFELVSKFISGVSGNVVLKIDPDTHKLHIKNDGRGADFATINPEYVNGRMQKAPSPDWLFDLHGEVIENELTSFVKDAKNIIDADWFILGIREDGVYAFSKMDDSQLHEKWDWDDFDDHEVRWSEMEEDFGDKPHIDSIFSTDFFTSMSVPSGFEGQLTLNGGDSSPIRIVADYNSGAALSYILAPRLSNKSSSKYDKVPDSIVEQYD
jgi:hypothetical protein